MGTGGIEMNINTANRVYTHTLYMSEKRKRILPWQEIISTVHQLYNVIHKIQEMYRRYILNIYMYIYKKKKTYICIYI